MKNSRFAILILIIFSIIAIGLAIFGPLLLRNNKSRIEYVEEKNKFITAKGIVDSMEQVEIGSQISGIILKILVKEGDFVKRGAPLVILDDSKIRTKIKLAEATLKSENARLKELESGYRAEDVKMAESRAKKAEAIYEKAKDKHERQKRLYEKDATTLVELELAEEHLKVAAEELDESKVNLQKLQSGVREEEIEQAKAAFEKAQSELQYYHVLLKDYTIQSHINGIVTKKLRNDYETVDIGTPILELVNPEKLRIRAELEETDIGKVRDGQKVEVYTDAYKDKIYHGTVYNVLRSVQRKSQRTFDPMASFDINTQEIFIKLQDFSGLKNGMSVTVKFLK